MLQLSRNGLILQSLTSLDESQGSSNVKVSIQNDGTYTNYSTQLHYGYYVHGFSYTKGIARYENGVFILPREAFEQYGILNLSVLLVSSDEELMTNQVQFIVQAAPRGDMIIDDIPSAQQQVLQLVQTTLDQYAQTINLNKNEIAVLKSRMDSFTSLQQGSTTGDAELIDGRVGYDGKTYENIGDAIRGQVSQLSDDIDGGINSEMFYVDNSGMSTFGTKVICKCNNYIIKNKYKIDSVTIGVNTIVQDSPIVMYILNENNVVLDVINLGVPNSVGKNTFTVEKQYPENSYIALSMVGINSKYITSDSVKYYSKGLLQETKSTANIGDTLVFQENVPDRYYQVEIDLNLSVTGLYNYIKSVDDKLKDIYTMVNYGIIPKFDDLSEEGYSLFGKWYSFNEYNECCNCGGQSVLFKVKNATKINVDIKELINPSNPSWIMAVAPYLAYSVDGTEFTRVQIKEEQLEITINSLDEHLVWIVVDGLCINSGLANRNSGWCGVYIKSITTDGKMFKVKPKSKQILFVGDSIVEGINTLGTTSTSESNSSVNEFSFKTAQKLGIIPLLQGYGGSTTWSGVDYTRYSVVDQKQDNFINSHPDIILIEYGYNDNSLISTGTKTKEEFIEQYNLLLDIMVGKYSGVPIICLIPFKQSLAQEIRDIASARNYCYVIETSDYNVTYSDEAHPNVDGAEEIAKRLSKDIENLFTKNYFIN